ncbi:hypothetical protein [uncultured Corynebacterium sp.]|uniref:hypothetical protein n=1 Tax=uncultured Corynebacterium sp. TaxID=159447 RepID=UPI0025D73BB8|nr:hypothetical protein [uncultured Corynebacterium sp.]
MAKSGKGGKAKKKDKKKSKHKDVAKTKVSATTELRLPTCSKAEAKAAKKLVGKDPFQLATMTPKKKCCKSGTRCLRCPVVLHKLNREIKNGEVDRAALLLVAAKARVR